MNAQQCISVLQALAMPVLNIWATPRQGLEDDIARQRALIARHVQDVTTVDIPGHHHWHMEPEPAEQIATAIRQFLG
jgi:hypothetical protein